MLLLYPAALAGLAAVALPIAIHILAKRRAERIQFPTLRFIQPGRLASVRRHVLEDAPLLAVRLLILAAAVLALSGPLVVTKSREAAWNAQLVSTLVEGPYLRGAMRRAVLSLSDAPPGRSEIVVRSAFPIGSIDRFDVMSVPVDVGLRFERTAALPETRAVDMPPVLTDAGARSRAVTLGRETIVREGEARPAPPAIDIDAAAADRASVDRALTAVLAERVLAPLNGHRVRIVFATAPGFASAVASASGIRDAWMADAVAAISRDDDLRATARATTTALSDARLTASPWIVVANTADGRPAAVAAAAQNALLIVAAAPPGDFAAAVLCRSALNAIGDRRAPLDAETIAIPDAQLSAWTRAPGPAPKPRLETVDRDDRRWLWIAALALLALEWTVRRRPVREPSGRRENHVA
jgi:hypothetical protein